MPVDHLPRGARVVAMSTLACAALAALMPSGAHAQAGAAPGPAENAERASLTELRNTTLALIDALVEQGLLTRAKADELMRKARSGPATTGSAAEGAQWGQPARPVVRVPYLAETTKAQIKEDIRNDILATARDEGWTDGRKLPGWLKSVSVEGDVRVRAQGELFDKNNAAADLFTLQNYTQESPAWAPDLTNTQNDRSRMTLRARVGVTVKAGDVSGGVRIATGGASGSPSSESQTLGNNFNRLAVGFDRAWLQWEPVQGDWLKGGRMAVPFDHSELLWPDDLAIDGIAAKGELDLGPGLYGFALGGAFPLEEFAIVKRDRWLYGAQLGLDWASSSGDWQLRAALAYYNFQNIAGVREDGPPPVNQNVGTVPYLASQYPASVRQKGNTLINLNAPICVITPSTPGCSSTATWGLASKFRPVDLTLGITAKLFRPYQANFDVDIVRNTGFDLADISRRAGLDLSGLKEKTTGYQLKLGFGMPRVKDRGDWRSFLAYRHFERDAWVDAFTDSGWHGGGTNYKGFGVGGEYAFVDNASIGLRYFSTRELDDGLRYTNSNGQQVGNMSSAPLRIDTVQVEANLRF